MKKDIMVEDVIQNEILVQDQLADKLADVRCLTSLADTATQWVQHHMLECMFTDSSAFILMVGTANPFGPLPMLWQMLC